jgi:hypothetical protein
LRRFGGGGGGMSEESLFLLVRVCDEDMPCRRGDGPVQIARGYGKHHRRGIMDRCVPREIEKRLGGVGVSVAGGVQFEAQKLK